MTAFSSSKQDPHLTACLGYWSDSLEAAARSYLKSTQVMLAHVIENGRDLDTLVLPILFSWRHYLELRFKTIALDAAMIDDDDPTLDKKHGLERLWSKARERLVQLFPDEDHDAELGAVDRHVAELHKIDPGSMTFRYTIDVEHKRLLPSELTHVGYLELADLVETVSSILEASDCMLAHARDYTAEARANEERI